MLLTALFTASVVLATADDPIVQLSAQCPQLLSKRATLHLTADVPAYGLARCRNGGKQLVGVDQVNYSLEASFDQSYSGTRCLFYKKEGTNTYTVDVEVGWGERNREVLQQRRVHTISCSYDDHGRVQSATEVITAGYLNPLEKQLLLGENSTASFDLKIWNVLDQEVTSDHFAIGRKIRLAAIDSSGSLPGFRALSCVVRNSVTQYDILRAGCGDGLVFGKVTGFRTEGAQVFSPYFSLFKLAGGDDTVQFECIFTVCEGTCNGSSCPVETGTSIARTNRRSEKPDVIRFVVSKSRPLYMELLGDQW